MAPLLRPPIYGSHSLPPDPVGRPTKRHQGKEGLTLSCKADSRMQHISVMFGQSLGVSVLWCFLQGLMCQNKEQSFLAICAENYSNVCFLTQCHKMDRINIIVSQKYTKGLIHTVRTEKVTVMVFDG